MAWNNRTLLPLYAALAASTSRRFSARVHQWANSQSVIMLRLRRTAKRHKEMNTLKNIDIVNHPTYSKTYSNDQWTVGIDMMSCNNTTNIVIGIDHTDPSSIKRKTTSLLKSSNHHLQEHRPHKKKSVTFCPFVNVRWGFTKEVDDVSHPHDVHTNKKAGAHHCTTSISSATFEKQRQDVKTRYIDVDQEKTPDDIPLINTYGKVCHERRMQRRMYSRAVLSYQKRLQRRQGGCNDSSSPSLLLAPISIKFSQRAKEIALETARQTLLDVYPSLTSSSPNPIRISKFPEIKKRRSTQELLDFEHPQLKRRRSNDNVQLIV